MINKTKVLEYSELDINPCSLTYGVEPCTAILGGTGDFKCYNSPRTCQDPANYTAGDVQTIRWAEPTADLPIEIDCQPCITAIQRRPLQIEPGEGLGVRESVTVNMHDFKAINAAPDKYQADRGFNTYNKGTYWGKFNAQWGSLQGYTFRTRTGYVGQTLEQMTTRWYTVESTQGPDSKGNFSFTVKDAMKFLDSDRAQWPLPSSGTLAIGIDGTQTAVVLQPTGVGDAEYPASGTASIGDEKVTFTRVGDNVTLTARGLSGTPREEHDLGSTFQIAVLFTAQDPAAILRDLLTDATNMPSAYIDYTSWKSEVDAFLGRLYTAEIMQPTSVKMLIEELVREAGLTVFCDVENQVIVLRVLRQEAPTAAFTDEVILPNSISSKRMEDRRITDVWVYHGKKNPLEKQSEKKNYAAIYAARTQSPIVALEGNPSAIRDIFSRWIGVDNLPAAQSVGQRLASRYERAPRQISVKVPNIYTMNLGGYVTVQSRVFEDAQGDLESPITCQVVQIDNKDGIYSAVTEEVIFGEVEPPDPDLRIIFVNADLYDVNLKTLHDTIYSAITSGQTARFVIGEGVTIGSNSASSPAAISGTWPAGVTLQIGGTGRIQGRGGDGGLPILAAETGGNALETTQALEILDTPEIYSGGGGGGGGSSMGTGDQIGGGGAGTLGGSPGGSPSAGGAGLATSGAGGGQGDAGGSGTIGGSSNPGGSPGFSIVGNSLVTITGAPDIKGPTAG